MTVLGYLELSMVALSVLAIVLGGYCLLAERARRLITSPRSLRVLNRVAGTAMASAAVAVATK